MAQPFSYFNETIEVLSEANIATVSDDDFFCLLYTSDAADE